MHKNAKPLLERYDHILLDMNGTFLFGFDRFGEDEDFAQTYKDLGFGCLGAEEVNRRVRKAYAYMAVRYLDEAHYDDFPSVEEALERSDAMPLSAENKAQLVHTFAMHELGHLPSVHAEALHSLAAQRPLHVLSNLWSPADIWLHAFQNWGLDRLFGIMLFSSEDRYIKPHAMVFQRVLDRIGANADRVLYIGDSYRCDVLGARNAGLDVVWLHGGKPLPDLGSDGIYAELDLPSCCRELLNR